jgi:hypothetical protein
VRFLAVAAVTALLVLFLTGCEDRKCLQSHSELLPMTMVGANGQPYIQFIPTEVCDRYEETTP